MLVGLQSPSGMAKLLLAWMGEPSPTLPSSQGRFDLSSAGSARVAGIIWGAAQPHPLVGWANSGGASSEQTQEVPALSSSFGKGNSRLCLPELVALGGCCPSTPQLWGFPDSIRKQERKKTSSAQKENDWWRKTRNCSSQSCEKPWQNI